MKKETISSYSYIALFSLVIFGYEIVASITSFLGLDNSPYAIFYRAFRCLMATIIIFIHGKNTKRWPSKKYMLAFLAFWVMYLVRVYVDVLLTNVDLTYSPSKYLITVETFLVSFSFIFAVDREVLRKSLVFSVYFGTLTMVGILSNYIYSIGLYDTISLSTSVIETPVGFLGSLGTGYKGSALLLISLYIIANKSQLCKGSTLFFAFSSSVALLCVLVSSKRGPILGFVVGFLSLVLIGKKSKIIYRLKRVAYITFFAALVTVGVLQAKNAVRHISGSFLKAYTLRDVGVYRRVKQAKSAYRQFAENPIIGDKIVTNSGSYAHNLTIESFMSIGVLGGTIWLYILIISLKRAINRRKRIKVAWIIPIFLLYMVQGHVSGSHWGGIQLWSMIAISLSVSTTSDMFRSNS